MLNPMVGGTGLKIKTVEALAHGRPILSTAAGGVGLEEIHKDLLHKNLKSLVKRLIEVADRDVLEALAKEMNDGYSKYVRNVDKRVDEVLGIKRSQPSRTSKLDRAVAL